MHQGINWQNAFENRPHFDALLLSTFWEIEFLRIEKKSLAKLSLASRSWGLHWQPAAADPGYDQCGLTKKDISAFKASSEVRKAADVFATFHENS